MRKTFLQSQVRFPILSVRGMKCGRVIKISSANTPSVPKRWNPAHLLRPPSVKIRPEARTSKNRLMRTANKNKPEYFSPEEFEKMDLLNFSPHKLQAAQNFFAHATVEWRILTSVDEIDPKVAQDAYIQKSGRSKPIVRSLASLDSSSPVTSATSAASDWAAAFVPEVVVVGRSNVGKSSLLNALLGSQRKVLRVSRTPGTTREVHFLDLIGNNRRLRLVDMPGYGLAQTPTATVEQMSNLLRTYFISRFKTTTNALRTLLLLIDVRCGIDDKDRDILQLCTSHTVSSFLVFTKVDKVSQSEFTAAARSAEAEIAKQWPLTAYPRVLATSAVTLFGVPQLQALILDICSLPWQQNATTLPRTPLLHP
jgi:GTP-binding protein